MSIVLALDASGSMRHREAEVIASAHAFAAALRPQDQLGILLFSDSTTLVQDLSTDREATRAAIDTYKTGRAGPRCSTPSPMRSRAWRRPRAGGSWSS